ncbi:NADPH-dependent 2,4-dienoyl-CoA reductase [Pseudomonas synxantha]|uniref:NADPH-dependent 2,4-dienoyl-CoA reductase n=1 Tax=Pseudomonas synxantha TaxID=47883 RepID=A0ABS0UKU6_9PSED|nr:NADPH-dependent 2,4-dienoyl-CoA reductase [Pseudomonas synxantha]MBI6566220.1 NADPH-dependent 2,4-dienoyl-CoA reductase [Pseudomonas synxantha]MBI6584608.1 NADPH-dependent 2,4-dienoyl-CoA reductase [Pseudomonas synxantha]MBI6646759.1 NADPH-dependent 2,4-dienoyl-CoA reductase [Pseudomonas synxantha]
MAALNRILTPLTVGTTQLPNRMVMGAMHTRLETLDRPHERLAAFYAARAEGEIGLILSGGYSPNPEGVMENGGPLFNSATQLDEHRAVTEAVHQAGGRIILQILHAGRYAKVENCVAPSPIKARINTYVPRELTTQEVWRTLEDFVNTAALAIEAGYDGVEIMGSEGYLLNEFTAALTNHREDEFGGSFDARLRLPLEIIRAVRQRIGKGAILIYRISSIDLMEGGMSGTEIANFAGQVESAGADLINTGVGWHESAVPTIGATVPRAVWRESIRNVKRAVSIPVMASNRINTPEIAEALITSGDADLVSMARPLLADPDFAKKVRLGTTDEINTCIACNQACLDRIFTERTATCLVNPRAGREIEFPKGPAPVSKRVAVVGGGPSGMAFAINASERGHRVTLFEADTQLGGQLNLAKAVPGKAEFHEMLRYFRVRLDRLNVTLNLGKTVNADDLLSGDFDEVVIATGVKPRIPDIAGIDHSKVVSYVDVLKGTVEIGSRVAIIGAGGIGFDVAEFLVGDAEESLLAEAFFRAWGVDPESERAGGLSPDNLHTSTARAVCMFQRKAEPLGKRLGKSTGWILKAKLRKAHVQMIPGAHYTAIDDDGLHYSVDGNAKVLPVDHVILCSGQIANRDLFEQLQARGVTPRLIGGADVASELDALRAIDQATRLAVAIV